MQNGEAPSAELVNRIEYSEKYMDDMYEYRCVHERKNANVWSSS